jgi:hypothetical protein
MFDWLSLIGVPGGSRMGTSRIGGDYEPDTGYEMVNCSYAHGRVERVDHKVVIAPDGGSDVVSYRSR